MVAAEQQLDLTTLGPPDPSVPPDPDTWIARLGSLPLLAQPGERWMHNTGAAVLGVLLARAAGALARRGAAHAAVRPARDARHRLLDRPDRPAGDRLPPHIGRADQLRSARRALEHAPSIPRRRRGLVSTANDLAVFARMLLADGIGPAGQHMLRAQLVRAMTCDQLTAPQKARGGLGQRFLDRRSWGFCHAVYDSGAYGWDGGFGTSWLVDPARALVVIVLTQRMFESPTTPQLHRDIQAAARADV